MKPKVTIAQVEDNRFTGVEGMSIIKTRKDGSKVRIILTREGPKEYPITEDE